jgi:hypothetical protein
MKKLCILLLVSSLFIPCFAFEFGYPVGGEDWYYIKVIFSNKGELENGKWNITEVQVNGLKVRDFLAYQLKKEVLDKKIDGGLPFEIKARSSWEGDKEYEIKAELKNPEAGKSVSLQQKVKSPARKGYWDFRWKNYLSLLITEESGYQRTNYPVQATVGILSKYLRSPDEIRVVKAEKKGKDISYIEIPCQVYDVIPWEDAKLLSVEERDEATGKLITRYHPTTTLSIALQVNLKPYEKATYLVFYNNPDSKKPSCQTDLRVEGKGLAKTIENSFYKVVLHEKSGMIYEIYEKQTGIKLEHKLETNGAIHWNPGAYSPPHVWSHCSDWENLSFSEETGPVFYSLRRTAALPHLKDVEASITYYFYKDSPFIIMEAIMEIKNDLFVKALRSGEVVFNKEVFDKAAYKTLGGKVNIIDLARSRMHPEHAAILRPDTPWIAFFSQEKKIAFSSLFLELSTSNLYGGEASLEQPYIYIQHGPWYYLSRAFVYSFGSNNQTRMLPVRKGSIYQEKTAWIPFSFKKNGYSLYIDKYYNMLKNPLSIVEKIETYPESPEGWLAPILTGAFEEGVKGAIGGKKKK